jgi:steroid 5-alpha reductase family enzyme
MIYLIVIVIGIAVFLLLANAHVLLRVLVADVAATVLVFISSLIFFRNASIYDPYWSVAPPVIFTALVIYSGGINFAGIFLLIAVWFWGVRLTANWAYTFKNLATQDWRYDNFKAKFPRAYQAISFFGIMLFPTLIVYLCMLPGMAIIVDVSLFSVSSTSIATATSASLNAITLVGLVISVGAATLQMTADFQMHRFRGRKTDNRQIIRDGLWKNSRHPNYLGEILMWWGVYIMMLSISPQLWFLGIGALANTLMFLTVSIPMADKRNCSLRSDWDAYRDQTNRLIPIKIRKND